MARRHAYKGTRTATKREQTAHDKELFANRIGQISPEVEREHSSPSKGGETGGAFQLPTSVHPAIGGSNWGRSLFLLIIAAFGLYLIFSKGTDGKPRIESVLKAFQGTGQLGSKIGPPGPPVKIGKKVKA